MPYRYLHEIAISDVAFEATGKDLEALFRAVADATAGVMVEDISSIGREEYLVVNLEQRDLDMLLFDFINEIIYLKDTRRLLLRAEEISIRRGLGGYALTSVLCGEPPDPKKHALKVDVKAVTLYRFEVVETTQGWKATVVLDV